MMEGNLRNGHNRDGSGRRPRPGVLQESQMKRICLIAIVAVVSIIAGCSRNDAPAAKVKGDGLVPFMDPRTNGVVGRWGFREVGGKVVVPAQYLDAASFFCEGFAWVDTDYCDHPIPGTEEKRWAEMPRRGTFIDSSGRALPLPHVHSVQEPWDCDPDWKPPRFDHGLAFVRLADGSICGLTTNGAPLAIHEEFGMFVDSSVNPQVVDEWYWHYRGDWSLVGLADGRIGILDGTRCFAVGPTNDAAFVRREWRNGVSMLDPFEFPDAGFCRWLDAEVEMEGPMLLPIWKLCGFLQHALKKATPDSRLDIDCRYFDSHTGILIKESPKTIRELLEQVQRDNWVYPMISRTGIYFVGLNDLKKPECVRTDLVAIKSVEGMPTSPAVPLVSFSANADGGARVFFVNPSREAYLCEIRQSRNNYRRNLLREHNQHRFPADSPEDRTYYIPLDRNVFADQRNSTSSSMGFLDFENIGNGSVSVAFTSLPVAGTSEQPAPETCPISGTWQIDGDKIVLSVKNGSSSDLFVLFGDEGTGVDFPLVYINGRMMDAESFEWVEPLKPVDSSFPFFVCLPLVPIDGPVSSKTFSIPIPDGCLSVESVRLQFSVAVADHILFCKNTGEMLSHFCRFTEVFSPVEMAEHKEFP